MSGFMSGYMPPGFNTVTPYFFVSDAERFVAFLVRGLGGIETCRTMRANGLIQNVIVQLGASAVMVSEAAGKYKAMAAADMPYGDRQGGVRDAYGNIWWISQRLVREPYSP
jgi:PhnB protein